nr:MAG TPA: hypothetical protein [Caudoviricetes sp.]
MYIFPAIMNYSFINKLILTSMHVSELNRSQLTELKQSYLMQNNEEVGEGTSYDELVGVDSIISDEMIYEVYSGINFTEDDFSC